MRMQGIAASAALPIVVGSFAYFITANNPALAPSTAATVVRVCGVLSLGLFAGALANALLAMRQPWPWARSLPWSARARVLGDACVLGIPLCAVPVALCAVNATQALVVASVVPLAKMNWIVSTDTLKTKTTMSSRHSVAFLKFRLKSSPKGTKVTKLETVSLSPVSPKVTKGIRLRLLV